jgi:hypothetical protein
MLGIINPERRGLHRSRSAIISPVSPRSAAAATAECPRTRCRRDSLPGALSLTEAYNVMTVDVSFFFFYFFFFCAFFPHYIDITFLFFKRNAVLATIDMLNI